MSETKEPKIKLFGKTIQLPDNPLQSPVVVAAGGEFGAAGPAQSSDAHGDDISAQYRSCSTNSVREESNLSKGGEEQESEEKKLSDSNAVLMKNENLNAQSADNDNDTAPAKTSKSEEEQSETGNSDEKTLKKPDKIVPCPRCNSMDTKFCYFNNYNVNQPRHFCKNCQRYWTAGGTMRNVPVGAGRRKNKNSTTHYRHVTVPEALQAVGADLPNGTNHPTLNQNGTILTFGSDTPLCESMASVLNIAEKSMQSCSRNGFHQLEDQRRNDQSNETSLTAGIAKNDIRGPGLPEIVVPNGPNFPPVPYFPTGPWPYPWNSVPWSPPVPPPGFCPSGFPMPHYPAIPYWGCSVPGTWNVPWITPPTPSQTAGPISPTLGKHLRDDNDNKSAGNEEEGPEKETNPERCLWVPKTLRIDDLGEAAKSSIWATLGIKNEKADRVGGGGLFKTFESKAEEMIRASESSTVLEANPAALSRSFNFRESS